ncbi:MAG: SelT/SelW/SelH family protein [Chloroflexi bacterium]|nr:SelT/SelW/SelH family protein [Chloroflexota bacterium]
MAELVENLEDRIEEITLVPSGGGKFEITVNENLVYSKLKTKRHAEAGEVLALVRKIQ